MVWSVVRPVAGIIHIFCVILLAGTYVFTYYDYLHTVTSDGLIDISSAQQTDQYTNGKLGVVVVSQEVTASSGTLATTGQ